MTENGPLTSPSPARDAAHARAPAHAAQCGAGQPARTCSRTHARGNHSPPSSAKRKNTVGKPASAQNTAAKSHSPATPRRARKKANGRGASPHTTLPRRSTQLTSEIVVAQVRRRPDAVFPRAARSCPSDNVSTMAAGRLNVLIGREGPPKQRPRGCQCPTGLLSPPHGPDQAIWTPTHPGALAHGSRRRGRPSALAPSSGSVRSELVRARQNRQRMASRRARVHSAPPVDPEAARNARAARQHSKSLRVLVLNFQ